MANAHADCGNDAALFRGLSGLPQVVLSLFAAAAGHVNEAQRPGNCDDTHTHPSHVPIVDAHSVGKDKEPDDNDDELEAGDCGKHAWRD